MITLLKIAYALLMLGLILGSIWYVPRRLAYLFGFTKAWPRYVAMGLTFFMFMLPIGRFLHFTHPPMSIAVTVAGLYMGFFLFLAMLLVVFQVTGRLIRLPGWVCALLALTSAIMVTGYSAWQAHGFEVSRVEIPIKGLEQDVTLVHIADAHIGHQRGRGYLECLVKETNLLNPDFVLLNGDLVDANSALKPGVLAPLSELRAPAFFTTGNHEAYVDTERALDIISEQGVRILHNEAVSIAGIQLIGLDYMNADENAFDMHAVNKLTIKEELPRIPRIDGQPAVLMHHSPVGLEYVEKEGIALMLSGHTHAGQVFPATLMAEFQFPLRKGLYYRGDTAFFVSQGAGTYGARMRLGTSNEINLITLKSSS